MVLDEVRRTGVYGQPRLPGLVQRAVDVVGWREICLSENVDAVRAHFLRVYEQLAQRARREVALPAMLRERLATGSLPLPGSALPPAVRTG